MLVKDETKYCWVDNGKAGEPQDSIKDAIADYLECIDDVGAKARDDWYELSPTGLMHYLRIGCMKWVNR